MQPSDFRASSQLLGFIKVLLHLEHLILECHPLSSFSAKDQQNKIFNNKQLFRSNYLNPSPWY